MGSKGGGGVGMRSTFAGLSGSNFLDMVLCRDAWQQA